MDKKELERLQKIEAAATALAKALKERFAYGTVTGESELKALNSALKPSFDWAKVEIGTEIYHRSKNLFGKFILEQAGQLFWLHENHILQNESDHFKISHVGWSTVIKHPWPEDNDMPGWVDSHDMVMLSKSDCGDELFVIEAYLVSWDVPRDWFAVLNLSAEFPETTDPEED